MPKQSLVTLETKQKVYLRLIVQMQKDLAKVTKSIQSLRSKPPVKKAVAGKKAAVKTAGRKPAAKKPAVKKAAAKKPAAKNTVAKKRGRPAKSR
jgi:hypothetical protein